MSIYFYPRHEASFNMNRTLLLGPPGCGKTTRLLTEIENRLETGTPPNRIAYVSFTRASVRDARQRASERFNYSQDLFPWWRTLHSLCFHALGLRRSDVFGREHLRALEELTGEQLSGHVDLDAPTIGDRGDALLFFDQYARNTLQPLEIAWQRFGGYVDWFRLKRFAAAYQQLRLDRMTFDFTDMLERYADRHDPDVGPIDVDVAFIDEAQDLTPLQWQVVRRAFGNVPEVYVAGDDDQGVFAWAGADVSALLAFRGTREVLGQSHRLPKPIYDLASTISHRIVRRNEKTWRPATHAGTIDWLRRPDDVSFDGGDEWLLLARTRRQLNGLANLARSRGVPYSVLGRSAIDPEHVRLILEHEHHRREDPSMPIWHDALTDIPLEDREYLLSCLRRGEKINAERPRVRIETIHGSKGLEAPKVLMLTDISDKVRRGMELDPDAENRVLYVGLTRASRDLMLVTPKRSSHGYRI